MSTFWTYDMNLQDSSGGNETEDHSPPETREGEGKSGNGTTKHHMNSHMFV